MLAGAFRGTRQGMVFSRLTSRDHQARSAFTLIEVLVVVAIIALLISILLPSMARVREQGKRAACLSHLHQMGLAFAGYSSAFRGYLPMTGSFRYSLMEGAYYQPDCSDGDIRWLLVNLGGLYPKYVKNTAEIFYCPNNDKPKRDGDNGMKVFLSTYKNPNPSDPDYQNAHAFPISPMSNYFYAVPADTGTYPRDAGARMYPKDVIYNVASTRENNFWQFMNDPREPDPSFLGPFPQATRGRHSVHALVSDAYTSTTEGYHMGGYNVLFGDFHARWIRDPHRNIHNARISLMRRDDGYYRDPDDAKLFLAWEYFSRNP